MSQEKNDKQEKEEKTETKIVNKRSTSPLRRTLVVNKAFQSDLLSMSAIIPTICSVFVFVMQYILTNQTTTYIESILGTGSPMAENIVSAIRGLSLTLLLSCLLINVVCIALIYTYGRIYSNRIAGPIFSAVKHLQKITLEEKTPALKFREKDYFKELATAINQAVEHLKNKKI